MAEVGDWLTGNPLGAGGQGSVVRAYRKGAVAAAAAQIWGISRGDANDTAALPRVIELADMLRSLSDPLGNSCGALKQLGELPAGADAEEARERMRREIQALREFNHPNVVQILDADPDGRWYVMNWMPGGTLERTLRRFEGRGLAAMKALRPLIDAVASWHRRGMVHRDIKPGNIFVDSAGALVLGDPGLVHFGDTARTRITKTLENVGTRDYMPLWAQGMRIADIHAAFDTFALGKVLYSMVSKTPLLQAWYHRKPEFDLELQFPGEPEVRVVNRVLDACLQEERADCVADGAELGRLFDEAIYELESRALPVRLKEMDHALRSAYRVCLTADSAGDERWSVSAGTSPRRVWDPELRSFVLEFGAESEAQPSVVDFPISPVISVSKVAGLVLTAEPLDPIDECWVLLQFGFGSEDRWLAYRMGDSPPSPDPRKYKSGLQWDLGMGQGTRRRAYSVVRRDVQEDLRSTVRAAGESIADLRGIRVRGRFRIRHLAIDARRPS